MEPAFEAHRLHFALTVTFHYLFPQRTCIGRLRQGFVAEGIARRWEIALLNDGW